MFTNKAIGELYQEFNDTIIELPHPDAEPYKLTSEPDRVQRIALLGMRLHNMVLAMPDDAFSKWGHLLMGMREILYLDSIHLPLAMKGDRSRDAYWYGVHNQWIQKLHDTAAELGMPRTAKSSD